MLKTIFILPCCGIRDILSRTSVPMPFSSNHLSAASFPVDQAVAGALVEVYPESRSESRTGVLLRSDDDAAAPAALHEPDLRSLPGNPGGKQNIGDAKNANGSPGHHSDS